MWRAPMLAVSRSPRPNGGCAESSLKMKRTKIFCPRPRPRKDCRMSMIPKKSPSAAADADRAISDLKSRLHALMARDAVVLEKIIQVEKTTGPQVDAGVDLEQAEALLEGKKFVAPRDKGPSPRAALYADGKVIAQALKIGGARLEILATERSAEIWASHFAEIAEV